MSDRWKRRLALPGIITLTAGIALGGWWGIGLVAAGVIILLAMCFEDDRQFYLVGPFAWRELIRSGRGSKRQIWRPIFALCAFFMLLFFHVNQPVPSKQGVVTIEDYQQMSATNEAFFLTYAFILLIVCSLLACHWASEIILEERQKTRWDILRATTLTSREIILGKMFGRLPIVVEPIVTIIPVIMILTFLGGVSPIMIVLTLTAVIVTAYGLGGMTLFYATYSSKPGQAGGSSIGIFVAYLIVSGLLSLPGIDDVSRSTPTVRGIVETVQAGNPFVHFNVIGSLGVENGLAERLPRYAAWHVFVGTLFGLVAISRLRHATPWDASLVTTAIRHVKGRAVGRDRPPVTDDSVMWWERFGPLNPIQLSIWKLLPHWFSWKLTLASIAMFGLIFLVNFLFFTPQTREFLQFNFAIGAWIFSWPITMSALFRGVRCLPKDKESGLWDDLRLTPLSAESYLNQKWFAVVTCEQPLICLGMAYMIGATITGYIPIISAVLYVISLFLVTIAAASYGMNFGMKYEKPATAQRNLVIFVVITSILIPWLVLPPMITGMFLLIGHQSNLALLLLPFFPLIIWVVVGYVSWESTKAYLLGERNEVYFSKR